MESIMGKVDLDKVFGAINQANQKLVEETMNKIASNPVASLTNAWQAMLRGFPTNATQWLQLQNQFYQQQLDLWGAMIGHQPVAEAGSGAPGKADHRFSAPEWEQYPLFDYIKQSYLMTSKALLNAVESSYLDDKTKQQMTFFTRQFIDAMSPANYPLTNPEVLKLAAETKGQNFADGVKNLMQDLRKGRISLSDDTAFEVGENLANTPGAVVYENELIQLIQYTPSTDKVSEIPLLIVPSVVNKYYILDLAPESSFVRYFVEQGYTVFMVSWRNISRDTQHLTWDDYIAQGVMKAIEVTSEITGQKQINALGYCIGGTLLSCALAVLAAREERPVASMTLLITLLECSDPGEIGVYLDRSVMEQREKMFQRGGVVSGKELTMAFSSLRANDLVWSFVINNYLKGKTPDAFDLFYWNSDDSNLPGPMFSYYLRNCYIDNNLVKPNSMTVCGTPVDLRKIDLPTYVFAGLEDHLVPWKSGYESVNHLQGEIEFVLGGGGHITGPINPVSKNKRNYWIDGALNSRADDWLASAQSIKGSWWPHWSAWLKQRSGEEVPARTSLGSGSYPLVEAAPGRFVKERVHP